MSVEQPRPPWLSRWPLRSLHRRPEDPPFKMINILVGWGLLLAAALILIDAGAWPEALLGFSEACCGVMYLMYPRNMRGSYRRARSDARRAVRDELEEAHIRGMDLHDFLTAYHERMLAELTEGLRNP